jgi:hypothetical protein
MQLKFTKGNRKFDRLEIILRGGAQPVIECPKQGIIPHDMVHFAVEAEIAAVGFLGSIAAGGDSGYTPAADDAHARSVERLVETVQAEAWGGAPVSDADFIALYQVTCDARGDTPLALDAAALAAIRARLAALTVEWAAIPVGGTLLLELPPPAAA